MSVFELDDMNIITRLTTFPLETRVALSAKMTNIPSNLICNLFHQDLVYLYLEDQAFNGGVNMEFMEAFLNSSSLKKLTIDLWPLSVKLDHHLLIYRTKLSENVTQLILYGDSFKHRKPMHFKRALKSNRKLKCLKIWGVVLDEGSLIPDLNLELDQFELDLSGSTDGPRLNLFALDICRRTLKCKSTRFISLYHSSPDIVFLKLKFLAAALEKYVDVLSGSYWGISSSLKEPSRAGYMNSILMNLEHEAS